MKDQQTPRSTDPAAALSRRTLFAGVGAVGAVAAVAAVLPGAKPAATAVAGAASATQPDGYRLTEHIKRYYETARV